MSLLTLRNADRPCITYTSVTITATFCMTKHVSMMREEEEEEEKRNNYIHLLLQNTKTTINQYTKPVTFRQLGKKPNEKSNVIWNQTRNPIWQGQVSRKLRKNNAASSLQCVEGFRMPFYKGYCNSLLCLKSRGITVCSYSCYVEMASVLVTIDAC